MEWIQGGGWPFLVASVVVVVLVVSLVYTIRDRDRLDAELEEKRRNGDNAAATQELNRQERDVAVGECEKLEERARELATRVDALEEALRAAREDVGREQGEVNALRRGQEVLQRVADTLRGRNADLEGQAGVWRGRCEEVGRREQAALRNCEGLKASFDVRGRELAEAERGRDAARAELADAGKEREALRGRLADAEADGARLRRQLVALREAMAGQVQEIQAAVGGGAEGGAGAEAGGEALIRDCDRRMAAGFPCVCGHALWHHEGGTRAAATPAPGHCCSEGCGCLKYEAAAPAGGQALTPAAFGLPRGVAAGAVWEAAAEGPPCDCGHALALHASGIMPRRCRAPTCGCMGYLPATPAVLGRRADPC